MFFILDASNTMLKIEETEEELKKSDPWQRKGERDKKRKQKKPVKGPKLNLTIR